MVVFFHCEKLMSLGKYWHSIHHYFYFGSSGVDFFFVLSGIVILFAHEAQIGCPQHLPEYAWKRFRRIYPIYWCVLLLALAVYFVVPAFGNGTKTTPGVILGSIMLLPLTSTETVLPVAWTLFHEIMFYLVFSLFLVRRSIGIATLFLWLAGSLFALIFQFHPACCSFTSHHFTSYSPSDL